MIYLDNSSTTKQATEVSKLIYQVAEEDFGNPSSLHDLGMDAEKRLNNARKLFANSLGVSDNEIFFNSGGTEGDNTVIYGAAHSGRHKSKRIITSAVEHPAVLEACKNLEHHGYEIVELGVNKDCMIDLAELENELSNGGASLVSIMSVNNEVGSIMPIKEAAKLAHEHGALFHTDAVQGYGKINLKGIDVDFITVSAHKVHGPKGVGAIYMKKGVNIPAFISGGGQEKNFRSGTENVPGIAGFGEAVRLIEEGGQANHEHLKALKARLLGNIKDSILDIKVNSPENSCDAVLNISFLGTRGEVILHTLETSEIYVSTGSACSSNHNGKSHVLRAMGLNDKEIEAALRFSFSRYNTLEDMDIVADKLKQAVDKFRRLKKR